MGQARSPSEDCFHLVSGLLYALQDIGPGVMQALLLWAIFQNVLRSEPPSKFLNYADIIYPIMKIVSYLVIRRLSQKGSIGVNRVSGKQRTAWYLDVSLYVLEQILGHLLMGIR